MPVAPQNIVFVTNRQQNGMNGALPNFGDSPVPPLPGSLVFGTAVVGNVDVLDPAAGVITTISNLTQGMFGPANLAPILASQNDILVFIHGADNSFEDGITRAAYNRAWLEQVPFPAGSRTSTFDVIAFSWPSESWPFIGKIIGYMHDQQSAKDSAEHVLMFLDQLYLLKSQIGGRRLTLLCHSMGNDAFAGGVERWSARPITPPVPLFDEVLLAAADEVSTTFTRPHGGRLTNLHKLAREITVYFSHDDIAMDASQLLNQNHRLGFDGPPNKADLNFFPPRIYDFVDCHGVNDYIGGGIDQSHQYYRQSLKVRADIAKTLAGLVAARPKYDPKANSYILFP